MTTIWKTIRVGQMDLPHRLALAPMTRSRAEFNGVPGEHAAEYYAQRASLGLLITEGVQPSADGQGYFATPGIQAIEHAAGWRKSPMRFMQKAPAHACRPHVAPGQHAASPSARRPIGRRAR